LQASAALGAYTPESRIGSSPYDTPFGDGLVYPHLCTQATRGDPSLNALAPYLLAGSAAIPLVLGALHLIYTFRGPKLLPRDAALQQRMSEITPVITREMSMWKAWIGFNASHSFGAIQFGVVYGYLSLAHPSFLFGSAFLLVFGLVLLLGYTFIAKRYWFSIPFRGILVSLLLYVLALAAAAA
jgi:hypothetical protein